MDFNFNFEFEEFENPRKARKHGKYILVVRNINETTKELEKMHKKSINEIRKVSLPDSLPQDSYECYVRGYELTYNHRLRKGDLYVAIYEEKDSKIDIFSQKYSFLSGVLWGVFSLQAQGIDAYLLFGNESEKMIEDFVNDYFWRMPDSLKVIDKMAKIA